MKLLQNYVNFSNKGRFQDFVKKAEKHGLVDTNLDGYSHKACHLLKKKLFPKKFDEKCLLLQSCVNLRHILSSIRQPADSSAIYNEFVCGRYVYQKDMFTFNYEYLCPNITEAMTQKKIIFIILDIRDYCMCPIMHKKTQKERNTYFAHSVTIVLTPTASSDYNCYYINSHGQDLKSSTAYDFIISRRRAKTEKYTEPIDIIFMKSYINWLNKVEYETEGSKPFIHFANNTKHVYYGINLQAGDSHGVCFIYPLIIWYYFGMFYNARRVYELDIGTFKIKNGEELIKSGHLGFFIETMFLDFCPIFKKQFIVHSMELLDGKKEATHSLQNVVEGRNILFTKVLVKSFVNFITQPIIKSFLV